MPKLREKMEYRFNQHSEISKLTIKVEWKGEGLFWREFVSEEYGAICKVKVLGGREGDSGWSAEMELLWLKSCREEEEEWRLRKSSVSGRSYQDCSKGGCDGLRKWEVAL